MKTIGIIGTGHMGASLARRLVLNSDVKLYLSNRTKEKAINLSKELNCVCCDNFKAAKCDYVLIGVKPQQGFELLESIKNELNKNTVIVSMMAGITTSSIKEYVSNPVIRIMPNTPVLVGEGMTFYCYTSDVDKKVLDEFINLMNPTGKLLFIEESKFDIATVISGSGPAYIDAFIDYLASSGMLYGLTKEEAITLTTQMVLGSAKLIMETGKDPVILKNEVCSPGGSTIEGVKYLDKGDFELIIKECVTASYLKNKELGKK